MCSSSPCRTSHLLLGRHIHLRFALSNAEIEAAGENKDTLPPKVLTEDLCADDALPPKEVFTKDAPTEDAPPSEDAPTKDAPPSEDAPTEDAPPSEDAPTEDTPAELPVPLGGAPLENWSTEEAQDAPKIKKKRKAKSPKKDRPPKVPNAYMCFYQEELKKEVYKGIALPERAKMIGATWRSMGDKERAPFVAKVAEAKAALELSA